MPMSFRLFTTAEWDALPDHQKRLVTFSRFLGPREVSRTVKVVVTEVGREELAIVNDNPRITEVR